MTTTRMMLLLLSIVYALVASVAVVAIAKDIEGVKTVTNSIQVKGN